MKTKPLSEIPPDAPYSPPIGWIREFYKRAVRDFLNNPVFELVDQAMIETSAATKDEREKLIATRTEMELAIAELEMVLDQVPNLLWRERGYEHLRDLIYGAFIIGSYATASDSAQRFGKWKQARTAREKRALQDVEKHKKLRAAIKAVAESQDIPLKKSNKYAESIYGAVRERMNIKIDVTWPSSTTIQREVRAILEEYGEK